MLQTFKNVNSINSVNLIRKKPDCSIALVLIAAISRSIIKIGSVYY